MNERISDWIKQLSRGPNDITKRYSGYVINGYRFHTRQRDARRKTQNSGVTLVAVTRSFKSAKDENPEKICVTYYGAITDIIELDYYGHFKYVLFKCDWFEGEEDKYGLTCVYFNRKLYKDDPFVLASQVQQCFFIEDPFNKNRHYVLKALPRDLFDMGEICHSTSQEFNSEETLEISKHLPISKNDCEVDLVREDVPDDIIENPLSEFHVQQKKIESDDEASFQSENESTDDYFL